MAPTFSPAERDRIDEHLVATARRLFATQGLRRTSLDDLVGPAGIAKSSFYSFHDSKESLYLHVMLASATANRDRLLAAVRRGRGSRSRLRRLLRETVTILDEDPLYRRLLTHPDEMRTVRDRLTAADLAETETQLVAPLAELVEAGQRAGEIVAGEPGVIVGVLRAVLLLPLHADEFGPAYPAVLDLLVDSVTTGLTTGSAR
ncbi:MAG TPA: TetR/AcrR family transcriptional regulator [Actinocatenispora sp.]